MRKISGFTLAEVLITLGIIGVVAAMTMPTLMNSTQGAQYKAAYKKALSALSQAVTLNVALDEWSFADLDTDDYTLANMLSARMNVVRTACQSGCPEKSSEIKNAKGDATYSVSVGTAGALQDMTAGVIAEGNTTLFFNDGIMFSYDPAKATHCTMADGAEANKCYGFIDVNGIKAPNRVVQCDNKDATDESDCQIKSPTDVYPVVFYDQTILPSTVPAKAVLYSK